MKRSLTENNKIQGISYAFTKDGIELPVLDITNPLFDSSIDEQKLEKMIRKIAPEARKRAESFNNIPRFMKMYLSKRSFIMAGLLELTAGNEYLSGLSTMMMKLGPGLIGRGRGKFLDRLGSKAVGTVMIRMRARDTALYLADSIKRTLKQFPGKDLCLINIGGGTATDSVNALILVQKSEPQLISPIKIELNILDVDDYGPYFACQSVKSLTSSEGVLAGLNISCRVIYYDWGNIAPLKGVLSDRSDRIILFSSEGGLFEYGSETDILNNMNAAGEVCGTGTEFTASLVKDPERVDPIMIETLHMTKIKPRLYGIKGLERIIGNTSWKIVKYNDSNPRYIIFTVSNK